MNPGSRLANFSELTSLYRKNNPGKLLPRECAFAALHLTPPPPEKKQHIEAHCIILCNVHEQTENSNANNLKIV